jgi:hypothetical protein
MINIFSLPTTASFSRPCFGYKITNYFRNLRLITVEETVVQRWERNVDKIDEDNCLKGLWHYNTS